MEESTEKKKKKFFILTNYRLILKKTSSILDEFLYGTLLNAEGIMNIDLNQINVVNIFKIDKNRYSIGFFFFYEKNWGPNVPLLGSIVNHSEYEELFKILKKTLELDENIIDSRFNNSTWYFRRDYDYKNSF